MNIPHAACNAIFKLCFQSSASSFPLHSMVWHKPKAQMCTNNTWTHQLRLLYTGATTQYAFSSQSRCRGLNESDYEDGPLRSVLLQICTPEPVSQFGNNPGVSPNSHGSLVSKVHLLQHDPINMLNKIHQKTHPSQAQIHLLTTHKSFINMWYQKSRSGWNHMSCSSGDKQANLVRKADTKCWSTTQSQNDIPVTSIWWKHLLHWLWV